MKYVTHSPKETKKVAGFLFEKISKIKSRKTTVIALEGELGAGKTTFVQGLAKAMKISSKIKSPTFVLIKSYKLKVKSYKFLYHLDCYRLRNHHDLEILGIKDILSDPDNIVLIEWSDRVKKILPKNHIRIHIDHISNKERKITVK